MHPCGHCHAEEWVHFLWKQGKSVAVGCQTNLQSMQCLVQGLQLGCKNGACHVGAPGHTTDRGQHSIGAVLMLISSMPEGIQPQVLLPGSVPVLQSLYSTKNMALTG